MFTVTYCKSLFIYIPLVLQIFKSCVFLFKNIFIFPLCIFNSFSTSFPSTQGHLLFDIIVQLQTYIFCHFMEPILNNILILNPRSVFTGH